MNRRRGGPGFTLIETLVAMAILSIMFAMGVFYWQGRLAQNSLRYGTFQVSSDIRQAQEMAKSERYQYTVAFTSAATSYTISRCDGGYNRTVQLPSRVTTNTVSVVWSAFGQPVVPNPPPPCNLSTTTTSYTINVQNDAGTATVSVDAVGGITFQLP